MNAVNARCYVAVTRVTSSDAYEGFQFLSEDVMVV